MMTDPNYPLVADGGPDDLPRTLRRERDAREREAREQREREARERGDHLHAPLRDASVGPATNAASFGMPDTGGYVAAPIEVEPAAARVTRFDVPFSHLVMFFLKAALAAIPALLLLGALLWAVGHLVQMFFPQLVKMQILIWFPNGASGG